MCAHSSSRSKNQRDWSLVIALEGSWREGGGGEGGKGEGGKGGKGEGGKRKGGRGRGKGEGGREKGEGGKGESRVRGVWGVKDFYCLTIKFT